MELKIDISADRIRAEIERDALTRMANVAKAQLADHFASSSYWSKKDGTATLKVKAAVDEFILSPRFDELVNEYIEKHAPESIERAIKNLLASRSRKAFFEQVPHE